MTAASRHPYPLRRCRPWSILDQAAAFRHEPGPGASAQLIPKPTALPPPIFHREMCQNLVIPDCTPVIPDRPWLALPAALGARLALPLVLSRNCGEFP
jgi:hypothetical protein